ncbi:MAG: hypothetical protein RI538_02120 [Salibaculum sp.]|uniref:hypothetical protein n=1 Tax=Salibaculum sp. TaxID=2855480 RepID=UPI0028704B35|nr:hypothetical protein [Salibaculum sp.]MDR9427574.1 hypothetical protein [Salibaculum sp.]MDR9481563.1 hypothetical protein [Salibaculum sp.]
MRPVDENDPKGLIYEAYRIKGISAEECRTIFLDWALSLGEVAPGTAIPVLLSRHGQEGHPMTDVLREGLSSAEGVRRRGGRKARLS